MGGSTKPRLVLKPLHVFKCRCLQQKIRNAIRDQLAYLLKLDYKALEAEVVSIARSLIFKKEGSPSYTAELVKQLEQFQKEVSRVKALKQKLNSYYCKIHNLGIEQIISFTDEDSVSPSSHPTQCDISPPPKRLASPIYVAIASTKTNMEFPFLHDHLTTPPMLPTGLPTIVLDRKHRALAPQDDRQQQLLPSIRSLLPLEPFLPVTMRPYHPLHAAALPRLLRSPLLL